MKLLKIRAYLRMKLREWRCRHQCRQWLAYYNKHGVLPWTVRGPLKW